MWYNYGRFITCERSNAINIKFVRFLTYKRKNVQGYNNVFIFYLFIINYYINNYKQGIIVNIF